MFTGIVQNTARIMEIKDGARSTRFSFRFTKPEKNTALGASIAVNGVCLTVAGRTAGGFCADVVGETLKATTLGRRRKGDYVNIERSLRAGDELGGHFVTGHVDGTGKILRIETVSKDRLYFIQVPQLLCRFMAPKGSVAVDGVSLTIQEMKAEIMKITIIPHTLKVTTLGSLKPGDPVNLEADMIARYLASLMDAGTGKAAEPLTIKKLIKKGF